jgi:AcrR family transcriptional regulator
MNRKKRRNLKQDLLKAAEKRIHEGGLEALSLRKLASDVGVTTMATYHHFANKKALLVQVAINGFNDLEQRVSTAVAKAKSPADAVDRIMQGYYAFARERPHVYHLMFGQEMNKEKQTIPEFKQAAQRGLRVVAHAAKTHMDQSGHETDLDAIGLCFWAILHGRICLATEGSVLDNTRPEVQVKNLFDEAIKDLFHINE